MKRHGLVSLTIACLMLFLAGGCANPPRTAGPPPEIMWPGPPEIPRIRFVGSVPNPIGRKGVMERVFDTLVGTDDEPEMISPYGAETDSAGRLFVVDTHRGKVHAFDQKGNLAGSFPESPGLFAFPIDIAIDEGNDRLFVTDSKKRTVAVFSFSNLTPTKEFGKEFFKRPTGIAVNTVSSELLVVDTLDSSVFRFDLESLELKGKLTRGDGLPGGFHYPTNIFVPTDGTILVSDSLNFVIKIFSPQGKFLGEFGGIGDSPGYFSRPRGVASDSDGNIYVVDALFDNVQIFDSAGRLLMAFGQHGKAHGRFWLPSGIFVDRNDLIYVSDTYNKRVQIFQYMKTREEEW